MKKSFFIFIPIILCLSGEACANKETDLLDKFLSTDDFDEMFFYSEQMIALEYRGIPLLLEALSASLKKRFKVNNYAKTNICIKSLHSLAEKGIFTSKEVPILIHAIKNQINVGDTYLTAETLRIITGIDPGYSKEFISSYKVEDESIRKTKIAKWEKWWKDQNREQSVK